MGSANLNETNGSDADTLGKLAAYRNAKGKAIIAASLLIPFGAVAFFVWFCTSRADYALDASVKIGDLQRIALIVHAVYFIMLPFSFELMIEELPFPGCPEEYRFGQIPKRADNLFWMMSCLSAELFFVGAVAFFLMASQTHVPRWTLIVPIAQCAYNMKNDLLWVGFGNLLSPIRKRMKVMALDWVVIGGCFAVYIHHFFTAT